MKKLASYITNAAQATLIAINLYAASHSPGYACSAWIFSWVLFMKLDEIAERE